MMGHKFSVVTTCFNDSSQILSYLDSIVNQSLPPSEIVVVDGGSKDNTKELVELYSKRSSVPIQFICRGRLNIAEAFNIGVKSIKAQYVLISCIGNKFSPTMCEDLYNKIIATKADAAYGLLVGINRGTFSCCYNNAFIGSKGLDVMSNRAVMYDKSVFERIGLFLKNFKYAGEDAEFLNRFNNNGLKKILVNKPVVFWETPNSWREYKKQCKNYAIAELQYLNISKCLLTPQMRSWYLILFLLLLFPISILFPLAGLLYFIIRLVRRVMHFKSFKVALLYESWILLKIYYSIINLKYIFPNNRVCQLGL